MKQLSLLSAIIASTTLLTACGGGGEGGDSPPPEKTSPQETGYKAVPETLTNLTDKFVCDTEKGELKQTVTLGVPDGFNPANTENSSPAASITGLTDIVNYLSNVNQPALANYDSLSTNHPFGDSTTQAFMSNVSSGQVHIGMFANGEIDGNDTVKIGDMPSIFSGATARDGFDASIGSLNWQQTNVPNSTTIYTQDMGNINFVGGGFNSSNLLEHVSSGNLIDFYVEDDTGIDFITMEVCYLPEPETVAEVLTSMSDDLQCKDDEVKELVILGKPDGLEQDGIEATTPSTNITTDPGIVSYMANVNQTALVYDELSANRYFGDTFMNLPTNITQGDLYIGLGEFFHFNDSLNVGGYVNDTSTTTRDYLGTFLDAAALSTAGFSETLVPATGNASAVRLLSQDVANIAFSNGGTNYANLLDYMNAGNDVDIVVQDDTSVDFVAMSLCYEPECAPEVEVDLGDAAQWSGDTFTEVQPGNLPSTDNTGRRSWAPSMNWFELSTTDSTAVLEIEFCACGDIYLDVERFKADNDGEVFLDGNIVVDHTGLGTAAFREDTWSGVAGITGSGTTTVTGTGTGVDHKLEIVVSDVGVVTGAAIEGALTFNGYLGTCDQGEPVPIGDPVL